MVPKIWSINFYEYGPMSIEKVLFRYDGIDITFVCLNSKCKRYICHCTDAISETSWLVTEVTNLELVDLITNSVHINDLFKRKKDVILAEKESGEMKYTVFHEGNIPNNELPDDNYTISYSDEAYMQLLESQNIVLFPTKSGATGRSTRITKFRRINVADRANNNKARG